MARSLPGLLRDQGRGVVGALVVSSGLLYTMEMWWHGWQLPTTWLLAYAVFGLAGVLAITRVVGFRADREGAWQLRHAAGDFMELVLQSFVTAYTVLLLFGVVDLDESLITVARLGLTFVVPLGFGAALSNALLTASDDGKAETDRPILQRLGEFAVGAVFVSMTVAPTEELPLVAAHAGWLRLALVLVLSVLVAYLVLYELEFRGSRARAANRTLVDRVGNGFIAYAVGLVVSVALLAAFGWFEGTPPTVWVQLTVILGLPASLGASGAQVVLG